MDNLPPSILTFCWMISGLYRQSAKKCKCSSFSKTARKVTFFKVNGTICWMKSFGSVASNVLLVLILKTCFSCSWRVSV